VAQLAEPCDYDTDQSDLTRGTIIMSAEVGMAIEKYVEERAYRTCPDHSLDSLLDEEDLTIIGAKKDGGIQEDFDILWKPLPGYPKWMFE